MKKQQYPQIKKIADNYYTIKIKRWWWPFTKIKTYYGSATVWHDENTARRAAPTLKVTYL